ncbi:helix-turn-helix domain-containing protein [Nonomuraea sp. NBC_01738]|uniref:helix-turn-helix domain-containing protein n=1 Tax=Nonomuraea sp. NBC_01738 TaxID=2976003 RepID=UPI002E15AA3D|nr:helix-turn-helix domain-containing protein [Nonomuraea sp. NBC_01738]
MALPKVGSIGEYIREQRQQAKISMRQLAAATGVSNPYLSQIERGLRKPSAEILNQIAKGLHISAQALYVQAGLIEDKEPPSDVEAAIRADTHITGRQRQVMIDIYESFRKENRTGDEQTSQNAHPRHDPDSDDAPLPEEFLAALEPYAAPSGNGTVTQETKEG